MLPKSLILYLEDDADIDGTSEWEKIHQLFTAFVTKGLNLSIPQLQVPFLDFASAGI